MSSNFERLTRVVEKDPSNRLAAEELVAESFRIGVPDEDIAALLVRLDLLSDSDDLREIIKRFYGLSVNSSGVCRSVRKKGKKKRKTISDPKFRATTGYSAFWVVDLLNHSVQNGPVRVGPWLMSYDNGVFVEDLMKLYQDLQRLRRR